MKFRIPGFRTGTILVMLDFGITLSSMFLMPQYIQSGLLPVAMTGIVLLPGGITNSIFGCFLSWTAAKWPALYTAATLRNTRWTAVAVNCRNHSADVFSGGNPCPIKSIRSYAPAVTAAAWIGFTATGGKSSPARQRGEPCIRVTRWRSLEVSWIFLQKLISAVAEYNRTASDSEMVVTPEGAVMCPPKDPMYSGPWYALPLKLFHENSIGGIVTDDNAQVLRYRLPVPGLFAAGDNIRGIMMPGDVGSGYIENTISALTYAICSGYIAGESVSC